MAVALSRQPPSPTAAAAHINGDPLLSPYLSGGIVDDIDTNLSMPLLLSAHTPLSLSPPAAPPMHSPPPTADFLLPASHASSSAYQWYDATSASTAAASGSASASTLLSPTPSLTDTQRELGDEHVASAAVRSFLTDA